MPIFGVPDSVANGALALKQTYLRYLDAYEKLHFLGEDDGDGDDATYYDEEDTRSRRHKATKVITTVPCVYNHQQHMVRDEDREAYNMSTQVRVEIISYTSISLYLNHLFRTIPLFISVIS